MCIMKLPMKRVLRRIAIAKDSEINKIIHALLSWQENVYPEYELIVLSLPKYNKTERERQLAHFVDFMRRVEYVKI